MPTLVFGVLLFQVPGVLELDLFSSSLRLSLLVLLFVGTFMVPSVLLYYLVRMGFVRSLYMTDLADRRLPYLLTAFVYFALAYLFAFRMQPISSIAPEVGLLLGSSAVSILLIGLVSLFWQISAHGVGIGGALGILASLMLKFSITDLFLPLIIFVILAGFVASARLKLNTHTPAEILAGLALGLIVNWLTVYYFFV